MREITIAPHTSGPAQHRHAQHDEGFYVISDTARFTIGDRDHDAPAGQPMTPSAVAEATASYATEPATEFAR